MLIAGGSGLHQVLAEGHRRRFGAVGYAELREDCRSGLADGVLRHVELLRDVGVGESADDGREHVELMLRQVLDGFVVVDDLVYLARDDALPGRDGAYGGDERLVACRLRDDADGACGEGRREFAGRG